MKKPNGITLIALVVTIVVLLILAGVALNLVLGENGIITKSQEAKELHEEEAEREQIELALAGYYAEGNGKVSISQFPEGKLTTAEGKIYDIVEDEIDNGYYSIEKDTTNGKFIIKIKQEAINTSDYGKKVVGYSSKSASKYTGNWRLFYQDEDYTYIIAEIPTVDSYSGNTYRPSKYYETVTNESGELKYQTGADVGEVGQNLNSMLKEVGTFFVSSNTNENIRTTAWLTDIEYWSNYKDKTGNAIFAIASPTVELYVKSFNATSESNGATAITIGVGTNGYTVDTTTNQLITDYNHGIYNYNNIRSWFLSSPGDAYAKAGTYLNASESTIKTSCNLEASYGYIRPVVCIPTSKFQASYTLE